MGSTRPPVLIASRRQIEPSENVMIQQLSKGLIKRVAEALFSLESRLAARWVSSAHRRLFAAQWRIPPNPEWFDHDIDRFYQWSQTGNSLWVERGAFSSLALKMNGALLELACGDGFNTKHFYSHRAQRVVAVDFDVSAIRTAKKKNNAPNVEYRLGDIREGIPNGPWDNICWDAAIEHFTEAEIVRIMKDVKANLAPSGILSGYTIVEREDGHKHLDLHEYEFKGMEDLERFLSPYFRHSLVFETVFPSRHNLYFFASDDDIPFSATWAASRFRRT